MVISTEKDKDGMAIETVKRFQENQELLAALKIIALGEKNRIQGKGLTVDESRAQLLALNKGYK